MAFGCAAKTGGVGFVMHLREGVSKQRVADIYAQMTHDR
jgi:hypothetical protein